MHLDEMPVASMRSLMPCCRKQLLCSYCRGTVSLAGGPDGCWAHQSATESIPSLAAYCFLLASCSSHAACLAFPF